MLSSQYIITGYIFFSTVLLIKIVVLFISRMSRGAGSICKALVLLIFLRLQVIIFVKSVQRCMALAQLLVEQNFPAIAIHRAMTQEERYQQNPAVILTLSAMSF